MARVTPTREELAARHTAATPYLREHLCPELDDDDLAYGERFWSELRAGRPPTSVNGAEPGRTTSE